MHHKTRIIETFVFEIVCVSPMLWALYCSDLNMIWRISSKINVLSHSIKHIVKHQSNFDIILCRNK